ncbi:dihydrolipoyl dehydrogenase family protein [Leucobacter japonicus]|uniref:dihydrolipoyl dehydrogenase family protein n=1 Tax=Leucobacter japonicus TaxID=1461259 RepID=UPI0006A7D895|nr:NAD(P)/FAD-dependent oxidoreductase [Leucobacter japonicus]
MPQQFDVIVIGAGPVGENVADRAVQGGLSVVIVESELVGGECSYWACMPSKALLRAGEAVRAAQGVDGARQAVTGSVDATAVLRRRDSFTSNWDDSGQVRWLDGAGIDLVRGHGAISGEREVTVTAADGSETVLQARHAVVVATGSAALLPDIPGLAEAQPWTNREATAVEQVPRRLAIVGGGVVAAELATAFATLGAQVTLLVRSGLLSGQEPFAGELVGDALRELGVDMRLGVSPTSVSRDADGIVHVTTDGGDVVDADEILVATGRVPRTGDIGLDQLGLEPGAWLDVDDTMRVTGTGSAHFAGDWLYAVGDVNHRALLTHQGKYQARAAGDAIAARANGTELRDEPWGRHVATADHAAVPQVTFTDPPVASVGLTAAAAERADLTTRVVDIEIGSVAGASVHRDGYRGTARMVVDESRSVIVGVTFVGPDVQELLQSATIAVVGEVPLERLWHAVPAYPTISEVWLRLLEGYGRSNDAL